MIDFAIDHPILFGILLISGLLVLALSTILVFRKIDRASRRLSNKRVIYPLVYLGDQGKYGDVSQIAWQRTGKNIPPPRIGSAVERKGRCRFFDPPELIP